MIPHNHEVVNVMVNNLQHCFKLVKYELNNIEGNLHHTMICITSEKFARIYLKQADVWLTAIQDAVLCNADSDLVRTLASTKVGKIEDDTSPLYPSDFNNLEDLRKKALSSAKECVELAAAYVSIAKGILK